MLFRSPRVYQNKPYFDRHEVDEARYTNKIRKKYGSTASKIVINKQGKLVGQHKSLGVLKREKDLTDFANKMYGDANELKNIRKQTGEYDLAKKFSYKQINKMDKKAAKANIINLRKSLINSAGGNRKKILAKLKRLKASKKAAIAISKYGKKPGVIAAAAGIGAAAYKKYKKTI